MRRTGAMSRQAVDAPGRCKSVSVQSITADSSVTLLLRLGAQGSSAVAVHSPTGASEPAKFAPSLSGRRLSIEGSNVGCHSRRKGKCDKD